MKSKLLPEACHEFKELTVSQVLEARRKNHTVTGIVVAVRSNALIVKLGENLFGTLPFEETTIYRFTYSNNRKNALPRQIYTLLKKKVRVKITSVDATLDSEDSIMLSRKANMLEALVYLSKCDYCYFRVTSLTPSLVFGDIGEGIIGRITFKEITRSFIDNVNEYFRYDTDYFVKIMDKDSEDRFNLSYKEIFPEYNPDDYCIGDSYYAIVNKPVDEMQSGYFISINPQVTGIMDVDEFTTLKYGERVICKVKRATPKGLRVSFVTQA